MKDEVIVTDSTGDVIQRMQPEGAVTPPLPKITRAMRRAHARAVTKAMLKPNSKVARRLKNAHARRVQKELMSELEAIANQGEQVDTIVSNPEGDGASPSESQG